MKPYYEHNGITIYHGDCREVQSSVLTTAAVLFTSPPYAEQRRYGGHTAELWESVVVPGIQRANATQKFVNLGLVHQNGRVREYWRPLLDAMGGAFGMYVWDQGSGLPGDWNGRLAPSFEIIFHFCETRATVHKTKRCRYAGTPQSATRSMRRSDNTVAIFSGNARKTIQETKIPDSVIRVRRFLNTTASGTWELEHPAQFPIGLPSEFIAAYSDAGDVILDPFMGSGTTLRAAKDLGRKAIGIEIEERYCEIAAKRLAQEVLPFE